MKILIFIMLVGLLLACKPLSHTVGRDTNSFPVLADSVRPGVRFKMLWDTLAAYSRNHTSTETFRPSEDLQTTCNMHEVNGQYYVSGYLKLKQNEVPTSFPIQLTHYTENIYGFRLKISQLTELVKLRGLIYIELNSKMLLSK